MAELDTKIEELVAIAASVAGNCIPCLKYHFSQPVKKLYKTGNSRAIEIAKMAKQRPINDINKLAIQLSG